MYIINSSIDYTISDVEKAEKNGWKFIIHEGKKALTNGKTILINSQLL